MAERIARSAAGFPVPRWGRRLLLVAAAGAGVWLLGCLGHSTAAQAEAARPVTPPSVTGLKNSMLPVAERAVRVRVPVPVGQAPVVRPPVLWPPPALPPVLRSTPAVLPVLPALPGEAARNDRATRGVPDASRPGSRPAAPAPNAGPISPSAAGIEPVPHPLPVPIPGPGIPMLPSGAAGQAAGSLHSLPLAEPASGMTAGPGTSLAGPWAGAPGERRRAHLPDSPPG